MSVEVLCAPLGDLAANTYIVTDKATGLTAVVDPGAESEELLSYLKDKQVKYILLTHGHFDHIMGAGSVKRLTNAEIAIHSLDADCLQDGEKSLFVHHFAGEQEKLTADILLSEGDILNLGETEIKVMHTPGHTVGGCCYIIEGDRIIFSGDTLFKLSAGRTDFAGGSARQELMSLSRLAELSGDYSVFPGHGEATTLDFERAHNRYVKIRGNR